LSYIENSDKILFQRALGEDGEKPNVTGMYVCSGFMVFNDTDICSELIEKCNMYPDEDDQLLINQLVLTDEFIDSFELLPIMKFPLAKDIYRFNSGETHTAILHHCATLAGIDSKIEFLKNKEMWYIKNE
jgi:hypothetical protein